MGKEWLASRDGEPASGDITYDIVNDMNGMMQCQQFYVGQEFEYTHNTNLGDKWFPFGNFADPRGMVQMKDLLDRGQLPQTPDGPMFNYITMLNSQYCKEPPAFFLKIDEHLGPNGVIPMVARIRMTY